jgi:hypothetical protein
LQACWRLNCAKVQGTAIAELTCPLAKLMAAVDAGIGGLVGDESVAREEI